MLKHGIHCIFSELFPEAVGTLFVISQEPDERDSYPPTVDLLPGRCFAIYTPWVLLIKICFGFTSWSCPGSVEVVQIPRLVSCRRVINNWVPITKI